MSATDRIVDARRTPLGEWTPGRVLKRGRLTFFDLVPFDVDS